MELKDLMTSEIVTVSPQDNLQEAASRMKKHDVGALPVCEGDQAVGIITDRDITVRAVAAGREAVSTRVGDVMTKGAAACPASYSIEEAASLMRREKIRRILVENQERKPIGIVSLADLALHSKPQDLSEKVLEDVSTPGPGS